jgi:hypothetical protein
MYADLRLDSNNKLEVESVTFYDCESAYAKGHAIYLNVPDRSITESFKFVDTDFVWCFT